MSVPIIIIELFESKFEALFCHTEVKFLIVNRNRNDVDGENEADSREGDDKIFGPFSPTLETSRLTDAVPWIKIPESRLNAQTVGPLLCSPVPEESFD